MTKTIRQCEKKIGYEFRNKELLSTALTHSSYCRDSNEDGKRNNERLEFLGDAFLDAVIGKRLFKMMPDEQEGFLTKKRSEIVCETSLYEVAKKWRLDLYIRVGKAEEKSDERHNMSILADAVEAILGAIYLDSSYEELENVILRDFDGLIKKSMEGKIFSDYKTTLQEKLQSKFSNPDIVYRVDRETGPDHNKEFFVSVLCGRKMLGQGRGNSKKEAEKNAAKAALTGENCKDVF